MWAEYVGVYCASSEEICTSDGKELKADAASIECPDGECAIENCCKESNILWKIIHCFS